jgi:REP element-mobilizing transposase RayT
MHSTLALGERSLRVPTTLKFIEERIRYLAKHFQVKLFHFAIESNHLHLVVMAPE